MKPFTLELTPKLSVEVGTSEAAQKIAIKAVENVAKEFGLEYVKTCIKAAKPNAVQALRFIRFGYLNDPSAAIAALFCGEKSSNGRIVESSN